MILFVFLLMTILGGGTSPLVKYTVSQYSPIILIAFRSILATMFTLPFVLSQLSKVKNKKNIKFLFLANVLFAGNWILFATGVQYTSVIMSQIIYTPTSLIVAIIGFLLLKEKLVGEQVVGLILTMFGMALLIYGSIISQDISSFGMPIGNFLIFCAQLSWSFYLVISRKASKSFAPLTITFFNFFVTSLLVITIVPFEMAHKSLILSHITTGGILGLIALTVFSSVMAFYLYQWLIERTSSFFSSLVLYPGIVFGSLIGIVFFGEKLTFNLIVGAFLIILGVFLATSYQQIRGFIKVY